MWIVGVRDWRCLVLALTSPVVLQGLYWGNLSLALLLPLALAWRYRERATIAGVAVGSAVAAKLIAWPLVVWLLQRSATGPPRGPPRRRSSWSLGSWAVVGFDGNARLPGAPSGDPGRVCDAERLDRRRPRWARRIRHASPSRAAGSRGLALVALAVWVARREDGDRRRSRCSSGPRSWRRRSPGRITPRLLFVPIAVTWPRLAPAWFFGYAVWLAGLFPSPRPAMPRRARRASRDGLGPQPRNTCHGEGARDRRGRVAVTAALAVGRRSPSRSAEPCRLT